jgi:hypothetical protein
MAALAAAVAGTAQVLRALAQQGRAITAVVVAKVMVPEAAAEQARLEIVVHYTLPLVEETAWLRQLQAHL